ncbi:hypothetical protein GGR57DRAFT_509012 [Xylariaceae sp. FL1272]|nr:hypothetical protein GGR57DRAFT_509012 [Xylariaceae sp. FL1272]
MVIVNHPLPGQPSSPWATRFPHPKYSYEENGTIHSGLAPADPRVNDPKRYDGNGTSSNPFQAGYREIDRIFWHEETQKEMLWGLETWEAAVLNRWLFFGTDAGYVSAGHRSSHRSSDNEDTDKIALQCYAAGGLKVDEARWLPFLRKDRWYDWIETLPLGRTSSQGLEWTLQTILYGPIEDWNQVASFYGENQLPPDDGSHVLVSPRYEQIIAAGRAPPLTNVNLLADSTTTDDWRNRLVDLMDGTSFCMADLHTDGSWGLTCLYKGPSPFSQHGVEGRVICLHTALIEKMADQGLCLGELCSLQIFAAITIVHEIMHALLYGRYNDADSNYIGNRWDRTIKREDEEPYLDCAGGNEAGRCEYDLVSLLQPDIGGESENLWEISPPLALVFGEHPMPGEDPSPGLNNAFAQPGALSTVYHPSSIWVSKMLSEGFWTGMGGEARKSDNFFSRHPLLVGRSPNIEANELPSQWISPSLQKDIPWSTSHDALALSEVEMERNMYEIAYRNGVYTNFRTEWSKSPWAAWDKREKYRRFPDAFAKRDEVTCVKIAMILIDSCPWDVDENTYYGSLPSPTEIRPGWAWHCLGLLMLASLPIRRLIMPPVVDSRTKTLVTFLPSAGAAARGDAAPVCMSLGASKRRALSQSVLYGDVGGTWDRIDPRTLTKHAYMQRAQTILAALVKDQQCIVHKALYFAISQAFLHVQASIDALTDFYDNDADEFRWIEDWKFDMPEYDPTLMRFDNAQNTFVPTAFIP